MSDVTGFMPRMMGIPPHNEDGVGGMHLYMPWWNYQTQARNQMPFARGYHIEFGGGRGRADAEVAVAAERARRAAALRRVETGDYGWCLNCDEEIDVRRLEIDPAAPLCLDCARGKI